MTAPGSVVALSSLRTRVRELANMESGAGTTFVTDAECTRRINEACSYVWDLLVRAGGAENETKLSAAIPTVAGTTYYALPTDFMHLATVILKSGNDYVDVPRWNEKELAELMAYGAAGGGGDIREMRYRVCGRQDDKAQRIELRPTPTAVWSLYVRYYPTFTELSGDSDTFDGINGWHKLACLIAARDLLAKEESEVGPFDTAIAREEARIAALANRRDSGSPKRIADTRGDAWGRRLGRYEWDRRW